MAKKQSLWKTKGMNRDLSVSAFNPEFSFENMNLRISTNDNNTLLSLVNEKGTAIIPTYTKDANENLVPSTIEGVVIGTAIINEQLVLFTTDPIHFFDDHIYVFKYTDSSKNAMVGELLWSGSLNFSIQYPLETMVSYESEAIQKVYWVDGNPDNQPRMINITNITKSENVHDFDFVPSLRFTETITVKKELGTIGVFAPGVIQYAFTYYNKYGPETNIVYTTPLNYISFSDRGGSPEEKVSNAFRITVDQPDTFDYIRIYSIQRTSINGTPIVKRIQDIYLNDLPALGDSDRKVSFLDTGVSGNSVDPAEMLYKGGEVVSAETIEQKDNTLFLGNLKIIRKDVRSILGTISHSPVYPSNRQIYPANFDNTSYGYMNMLTVFKDSGKTASVPCGGFKWGEKYRLGIQFQHKSGKWCDPIWLQDALQNNRPTIDNTHLCYNIPTFYCDIENADGTFLKLWQAGYRRARGVVVFPEIQDRNILCQGVVSPTVCSDTLQERKIWAQSSWFFRTFGDYEYSANSGITDGAVKPQSSGTTSYIPCTSRVDGYAPTNLRAVEIEGDYGTDSRPDMFWVNTNFVTFHSPDIEFEGGISEGNLLAAKYREVGRATFRRTYSDINIQTESPTASNNASGFIHKGYTKNGEYGIVAGPFFEDYLLDDNGDLIEPFSKEKSSVKYMVFPWQSSGSLNNDINRPADKGTPTAILKKKIISNFRIASTEYTSSPSPVDFSMQALFQRQGPDYIKAGDDYLYQGTVDTTLNPKHATGKFFKFNGISVTDRLVSTPFEGENYWWKTWGMASGEEETEPTGDNGLYKWSGTAWDIDSATAHDIGDDFNDLLVKKKMVRMSYRSTSHIVFQKNPSSSWSNLGNGTLPIVEICQTPAKPYGGNTSDALQENTWVPCGEPVDLADSSGNLKALVRVTFDYGDTYYQRYDCLKTFTYSPDSINQIVEIGSFMLETRMNIDGRYDRNRGQHSNINMSPVNFNLINPVYSQLDNFFSYRIMPEDYYRNTSFPNQLTWTLSKQSGADVDLWTDITMASTLELDGSLGKITKLIRFNDQILAFQDTGLAQIMYNENMQITTTEGAPIEIGNSGKVQGKKYVSNSIGCSNKWSVVATPGGVYFIDSMGKNIYRYDGNLSNLSLAGGMNTWSKNKIYSPDDRWDPWYFGNFISHYDKLNQDVLFISADSCLAFSERLGVFTSFYNYEHTPYLSNLENTGVWSKPYYREETGRFYTALHGHNKGNYCNFFGTQCPFWTVLIGNPEPQTDKIFTNLEFRACVDGDGTGTVNFVPFIPFDYLETWNEFQHGIAQLSVRNGHSAMLHHTTDNNASLKRKFRIWRCDIPRDNAPLASDAGKNISRYRLRPLDRMRNPWLYLKLQRNASGSSMRTEIHDLLMTYFG